MKEKRREEKSDLGIISDAIMSEAPSKSTPMKEIKNMLIAANLKAVRHNANLQNIRAKTVTLQDCFDQLIDYFNDCHEKWEQPK